jgi:hypothetical protein
MSALFFEKPILNSPYEYPARHWELDASGQPTQRVVESRRRAEFITPIPKPKKREGKQYGRWAFAEFTDVYAMQKDFADKVQAQFDLMVAHALGTNRPHRH